jgi:cytochrome c5
MHKFILVLIMGLSSNVWALSHHPQAFLKTIAGTPDEGSQIVQHYCATCHASKPLIQLGAPRIGNASDWNPRLTSGFRHLVKRTEQGFNAMPARGGCFECSDHQLILAILEMLPEESRKH